MGRREEAGNGPNGEIGVVLKNLYLALERLSQNGECGSFLHVHQFGVSGHSRPMQLGTIGKRNVGRSEASRSGSIARYGNAYVLAGPATWRVSLRCCRAPIK